MLLQNKLMAITQKSEAPQLLLNDAQRYEGVTGKAERENFARGQTLGNPWACFCLFSTGYIFAFDVLTHDEWCS